MSALKDRIKKQTQVQAKQNRKNRVERSIKNSSHGKTKPSKSDYKYIEGNISGSASGKYYGIKKYGDGDFSYYKKNYEAGHQKLTNYEKQQKGENPYEVKYKRTAGVKKVEGGVNKNGKKFNSFNTYNELLTKKEQDNYKKYGTLTKPDSELEKKVKKVASGVGKAVLGGLDIMGTPGYLITGATKGMVDGFNGNGKLDKGELKNAIKGATKNIKTSWDNKGKFNGEGKFGFGDVFDSVDALEERKKKNDPNYESKQIYRASTGNGFDRDKLSDKTKKTLNTIGGMGLDMALPMELNLPIGTLLKGTGKSFTKVAKNIDAGDVAKVVDKMVGGQKVDDIAKEVAIHNITKKANKFAGNIDPNQMEGVKLLGKELLSGEQVAKIGDATGISRAYNQVRHFMQQGQRNKTVEDIATDVMKDRFSNSVNLLRPTTRTPLNMEKEQYDLSMGFTPDWKLRKEAKDLDEGFKNKTYQRELSDYEKLTNEIQSWIKETERRENSGFKDITNARPKEKPNFDDIEFNDTSISPTKSFDEQIRELIGLGDEAELNTINNSDMSQLDNIPFDAIQAKRQPRERRIGNAPENAMFPYADEMSGKYSYDADELDAEILNERAYNKTSDSNRTNKINKINNELSESKKISDALIEKFGAKKVKTNVNNIDEGVEALLNIFDKPKTKTKLKTVAERRDAFNNIFSHVDIDNLTEEQSDIIKSIKHIGKNIDQKDKEVLIANINNIFFGGQGVVPDNIKTNKLKKISKFFDDVSNPLNKTQFDLNGASLLRADLTDPIFENKQDLLKEIYGSKTSLQDSINKTHFKAQEARRKGLADEYRNLTNKVDELSQKLIDRENLWTQIREMDSDEFFEKYPNMAKKDSKYSQPVIHNKILKQNYKEVLDENRDIHSYLKNTNKEDLVDEFYNKARAEVINEIKTNPEKYKKYKKYKNRKDQDSYIQKEIMERAEFYANNEMNFVNKENEVERIMNLKRNRETVEGNVRDNQIKELKQNVKNYRKKLELQYVDTKNTSINKYNVKKAKENIVKIIKSKWDDTLDERALSELYGQQIRILDELGVDRASYMPKLKEYETKMEAYNTAKREYMKSQKYKSQNTNPINELENKLKIKREQRNNVVERVLNQEGFTLKKKKLNDEKQRYLDKDEIDFDKYFMAQSGDNMGKIEDDFISDIGKNKSQATNDNVANIFDEIRQVLPNRKGFEEPQENISKYFVDPNTGEVINQPSLKINNKKDIKDFFKKKEQQKGMLTLDEMKARVEAEKLAKNPYQETTKRSGNDKALFDALTGSGYEEPRVDRDFDVKESLQNFLKNLQEQDKQNKLTVEDFERQIKEHSKLIENYVDEPVKAKDNLIDKLTTKSKVEEPTLYTNPLTGEISEVHPDDMRNVQKNISERKKQERIEMDRKREERLRKHLEEKAQEEIIPIKKKEDTREFISQTPHSEYGYDYIDEDNVVLPQSAYNKESKRKNPLLSVYDGLLKDFKANVTVNNPGWHAGNFVQNKLLNAQDIGIRSFFPRTDATDVLKGKSGEIVNESTGEIMDYDTFRKYLEEGGIMDNFINKETQSSSEGNPLSKLFHNVLRASGKNSIGSGFGLLQKNQDETLAKIQNVMSHMDDGDDILTAMDKAQKTLFDYDDLSDKEKSIAKRIIPFYAYAKKNTANQLDYLMNDQRMHTKLLNAYRNVQEQIPYGEEREIKPGEENYLKGRIQIPGMTKEHKGKEYNYMLNPKLPFNPTDSADGMTNFSPFINPLIDIAKNEDFFGEEIEEPVKYYLDELKNSYTHPIIKTKESIERHKEKGQDFRIPPEIMKILLGISGNYY